MPTLSDQYNSHILNQTINNKLNEIEKMLENPNFNEQQKESVLAYQILLQIILTTLRNKSLPLVPRMILDNLNTSVYNLSTNALADINNYYSQYQNLMDWYNRLPHYEKKSDVKESFNALITNFMKQQTGITNNINNEINKFKEKQQDTIRDWEIEKENLKNELSSLKQENTVLKKEITTFKTHISKQEEKITKYNYYV